MKRLRISAVLLSMLLFASGGMFAAGPTDSRRPIPGSPSERIQSPPAIEVSTPDAPSGGNVLVQPKAAEIQAGSKLESVHLEMQSLSGRDLPLKQTDSLLKAPAAVEQLLGLMRGEREDPAPEKSVAVDIGAFREAMRQAGPDGLDPAVMQQGKQAGMARLMADRKAQGTSSAAKPLRSVSSAMPGLARRTPLLPLPSAKSTPATCPRERDIERLTEAVENADDADNPDERDRLRLRLAAAYVGAGQRNQARIIYEDLAQNANRAAIRQTALVNLRILSGADPPATAGGTDATEQGVGAAAAEGRVEQ